MDCLCTNNDSLSFLLVGRAVPVASTNANEPAAAQQQQEQTDQTRNSSSANVVHQAFSGGDSGVRVVPLRTVVAMPSGINHLPSDSAASSVRLFYPLLARVRQAAAGNASDAIGAQASSQAQQGASSVDHEALHQSTVQSDDLNSNDRDAIRDDPRASADGMPFVSGLTPPANESAANQG